MLPKTSKQTKTFCRIAGAIYMNCKELVEEQDQTITRKGRLKEEVIYTPA